MRKSLTILTALTFVCILSLAGVSYAATLTLPNETKIIEDEAFFGDTSLDEVMLPEGITTIGNSAFANSSVKRIYLPESLENIAPDAFGGCESVIGWGPDNTYASDFFDNGSNLSFEHGQNPDDPSVSLFIFEDNNDGKTCTLTGILEDTETDIVIPSHNASGLTVTHIATRAFYNTNITSVVIPDTVVGIGAYAFYNCSNLSSVIFSNALTSLEPYENSGGIFLGCTSLVEISIPSNVKKIGKDTFRGCTNLMQVELHEGLTAVGSEAFSGCPIISLVLPTTLKNIGSGAFQDCAMLDITIPEGVTTIGDNAFNNCDGLISLVLPDSVKTLGKQAFDDCDSLVSIQLSCNLTSIGEQAFYSCDELSSITIPDTVKILGAQAFSGCKKLTSAKLSSSIKAINKSMFSDCTALTQIDIPDAVTSIGEYAFEECESLHTVIFHEGLKTIANYAFRYCSALGSVNLPSGTISLGESAFSGCEQLTSVHLPDSITTIGRHCFGGCELLSSIRWPEGTTTVNDSMFSGCTNLSSVILHDDVSVISGNAFQLCENLSTIRLPSAMSGIAAKAFISSGLVSIDIPNNITSIGAEAFKNCDMLTHVGIPNSVTSIGKSAFEDCDGLIRIELPETITSIADSLFHDCYSLESVKIHAGILSIGSTAFCKCYHLKSLYLPSGVQTIGSQAFDGCLNIESMVIPGSVTSIMYNAIPDLDGFTVYGESGSYTEQLLSGYKKTKFVATSLSETIVDGQRICGTVQTSTGDGVADATVYLISLDEEEVATARTKGDGSWIINGMQTEQLYRVSYGHNQYSISGGTDVCVSGAVLAATATLMGETETDITFTMKQNDREVNGIQVGTAVDFDVVAPGASYIRLVVDDIAFEAYPVINNSASFSRIISSVRSGTRKVQIQSFSSENGWYGISAAKQLTVTGEENLTPPRFAEEKLALVKGNDLDFSWIGAENAQYYTVYVYDPDGIRVYPDWRNMADETENAALSRQISGAVFHSTGDYSVQVVATGVGYCSATGVITLSVFDSLDEIEISISGNSTEVGIGKEIDIDIKSCFNLDHYNVTVSSSDPQNTNINGLKVSFKQAGIYNLIALLSDGEEEYTSNTLTIYVEERSITGFNEGGHDHYSYYYTGSKIMFTATSNFQDKTVKLYMDDNVYVKNADVDPKNGIVTASVVLDSAGAHEYYFAYVDDGNLISTRKHPVYTLNKENVNCSYYPNKATVFTDVLTEDKKTISTDEMVNMIGTYGEYAFVKYNTFTGYLLFEDLIQSQEILDQGGILETNTDLPEGYIYKGQEFNIRVKTVAEITSTNAALFYSDNYDDYLNRKGYLVNYPMKKNDGNEYTAKLKLADSGYYWVRIIPAIGTDLINSTEIISLIMAEESYSGQEEYRPTYETLYVFSDAGFNNGENISYKTSLTIKTKIGTDLCRIKYSDESGTTNYGYIWNGTVAVPQKRGYIIVAASITDDKNIFHGNDTIANNAISKIEDIFADAGITVVYEKKGFVSNDIQSFENALRNNTDYSTISYIYLFGHGNERDDDPALEGIVLENKLAWGYCDILEKLNNYCQGDTVIINDACLSGQLIDWASGRKTYIDDAGITHTPSLDSSRFAIITSTRNNEKGKMTNYGDPQFTKQMWERYLPDDGGIRLSDFDNDGTITMNEIFTTNQSVTYQGYTYHPQFWGVNISMKN